MMKCSSCGADLVEGSKFCIICGLKLNEIVEEESDKEKEGLPSNEETKEAVCHSCKAPLRKEALFCVSCGAKAGEPQEKPADPALTLPQEEEKAGEKVCPSCNGALKRSANFCVHCGTPVYQTEDEIADALSTAEKKEQSEPAVTAGEERQEEGAAECAADYGLLEEVSSQEKVLEEVNNHERVPELDPVSTSTGDYRSGQQEPLKNWEVTAGEEQDRQADSLDIIPFSKGVVSRITFRESPQAPKVVVRGKIKCHGCRKQTLFTITSQRGWGGANDPVTCPCGNDIVIGEYWKESIDAIFVWASLEPPDESYRHCPLSIFINSVTAE